MKNTSRATVPQTLHYAEPAGEPVIQTAHADAKKEP